MSARAFARAAAALALLVTACAPPRPPPPQRFVFHVTSDPGEPLAGARVVHAGTVLATSDASGVASFAIDGREGDALDVAIECPAGFQSPAQRTSLLVRRLGPGVTPEYDVACAPRTRTVVVAIRGAKGHRLPIVRLGEEIARTDANGVATVALRVGPQEPFDLAFDTTAAEDAALRPQSPAATFVAKNRDEVVVFDPRFTEAPKPPPPRPRRAAAPRKVPLVPVRIQ